MGCLNSKGNFSHWFGNIHLSGPCNRSCYFCIGQHMMALDSLNVLDQWPLPNVDKFVDECYEKGISEINLTGSNTDPMLYKHIDKLYNYLYETVPNLRFGIRTNGIKILDRVGDWNLFNKASISVTSFNRDIYRATMGQGEPPNLEHILSISNSDMDIKVNVVLCPELFQNGDLWNTINRCIDYGIRRINLREPYGQPNLSAITIKFMDSVFDRMSDLFGMPRWEYFGTEITYWDVHYVEVESVNLYANGVISNTYPVTEGHDPINGKVEGQENFSKSGRIRPQWVAFSTANAR